MLKVNSQQKVDDERKYKLYMQETYQANISMHEEKKKEMMLRQKEDERRNM